MNNWKATIEQLKQTVNYRYPGVRAHWKEIYEPVMGLVLEGATNEQAEGMKAHIERLISQELLPQNWYPKLGFMHGPDKFNNFAPTSQGWSGYDTHPAISLVYVGY